MSIRTPYKYKTEFCKLILRDDAILMRPLFNYELAEKLNVHVTTLYDWANRYPAFADALDCANTRMIAYLLREGIDNLVLSKDEKLSERTLENLLTIATCNKKIRGLRGVKNELDAYQIVQDALADAEISESRAETAVRVLSAKLEARKTLELAKDVELIKQKLGIE